MKLYDVYPLYQVTPVSAKGARLVDDQGQEYLDFYGGHAVMSIGHGHPHYIQKIETQLSKLGFYSNSILNPLQKELAELLGEVSGLPDYQLFLCNSGAEANENALKLASFHRPDSKKVIAFKNGFHGRTSAAVNVTDNAQIQATFNQQLQVVYFDHEQEAEVISEIKKGDSCAVILEVIQGVGGLNSINDDILQKISEACDLTNTVLIVDEVQSGYGRTGSGGNHLACAAGIAVLEVIKKESLMMKVKPKYKRLSKALSTLSGVKRIKGAGLMLGAEFDFPIKGLRKSLIHNQHLFTGSSKDPNVLRLLPPLTITDQDIDDFIIKMETGIHHYLKNQK